MKQRIFIAINLPEEVKAELTELQKQWPDLPCRWARKDNLHLTLVFLGYIRKEKIIDILDAIKEAAKQTKPFLISLNKLCYGPEKQSPPRLVWVKGQRSQALIDVKKKIEDSLSGKVPFIREKRELLPHITLARIRQLDWKRSPSDKRSKIEQDVSIDFSVDSIELMESHLKRTGAEYEIMQSFALEA